MERIPGLLCLREKFSSDEIAPKIRVLTRGNKVLGLTRKLPTVNRLAARSVPLGEVPALEHETRDDAIEHGALISKPMLTRRELAEVPRCLGYYIVVELEYDSSERLAVRGEVEL
jgi:hypothetical protein